MAPKVAEQIKIKNKIQKDPINFQSGINRSGTGKYGKKEFVFKILGTISSLKNNIKCKDVLLSSGFNFLKAGNISQNQKTTSGNIP